MLILIGVLLMALALRLGLMLGSRRRGTGGGTPPTTGQLDFSKAANSGELILLEDI